MSKHMLFGYALFRLVNHKKIKIAQDKDNQAYIIDDEYAILIKYSSKRLSPWSFTISKDFNRIVEKLHLEYKLFICLVCNDDGIVCLDVDEYGYITSFGSFDANSIMVKRKKKESYTVKGTENVLNHKIKDSDFPKRIFTCS